MFAYDRNNFMHTACIAGYDLNKIGEIELAAIVADENVSRNLIVSMLEEGYCLNAIRFILEKISGWEPIQGVFPLHLNAHRSEGDREMVSYTVPTQVAPFYKCVKTRPGKFISRYMPWLTPKEVQTMQDEFTAKESKYSFKYYLGNIPVGEAVRIYTDHTFHGTSFYGEDQGLPCVAGSCMRHGISEGEFRYVGTDQHPVMAYEMTPDVGIIWSEDKDKKTTARALINMKQKTICRVYISGETREESYELKNDLISYARELGLVQDFTDGLSGCKIRAIMSTRKYSHFLMPYIDGDYKWVSRTEDGKYFEVDNRGDHCADVWQSGAIRDGNEIRCCQCLNIFEDGLTRGGNDYCRGCHDVIFVRCYRCEDYCRRETSMLVDGTQYYCSYCSRHYSETCDHCGGLFSDCTVQYTPDGAITLCPECVEQHTAQVEEASNEETHDVTVEQNNAPENRRLEFDNMVTMVSGIACCRSPLNVCNVGGVSTEEVLTSIGSYSFRWPVAGNAVVEGYPAVGQETEYEDMNLQVGEVVTHPLHGRGTVTHNTSGTEYPVIVDFGGINRSFMSDGRYLADQPPSLQRPVLDQAEAEAEVYFIAGDHVFSPDHGEGVVSIIMEGFVYPVIVDFGHGNTMGYTADGRHLVGCDPTLVLIPRREEDVQTADILDEHIRLAPSVDLGLEVGDRVYHEIYGEGTVNHKEEVGTYPVSVIFDEEPNTRRGFTLDGRYIRYESPSLVRLANREHEDVIAI